MADIRYQAPEREEGTGRGAPALWNPNAAALWALLVSPAFSAVLHYLNAKALGDDVLANGNKLFLTAYALVLLVGVPLAVHYDWNTGFVGIGMTVGWYVALGRKQAAAVRERFGTDYPRRGWLVPVLLGIVGLLAVLVFMVGVTVVLEGLGV